MNADGLSAADSSVFIRGLQKLFEHTGPLPAPAGLPAPRQTARIWQSEPSIQAIRAEHTTSAGSHLLRRGPSQNSFWPEYQDKDKKCESENIFIVARDIARCKAFCPSENK